MPKWMRDLGYGTYNDAGAGGGGGGAGAGAAGGGAGGGEQGGDKGAGGGGDRGAAGGGGGTGGDWYDSLPPELSGAEPVSRFKGKPISEVVKSFLHAQNAIGGMVKIPGKDAKPEEVTAFYRKVGVPEKIEDYKIERPMVPEGAQYDENFESGLRAAAHKLNLRPDQLQGIVNFLGNHELETYRAAVTKVEEHSGKLKEAWGPNYSRNLAIAARAARALDPSGDLSELLTKSGVINHPTMQQFLYIQGKGLIEDGIIPGDAVGLASPAEMKKEVEEIKSNKQHPLYEAYWSRTHPRHQEAMDRVMSLMNEVFPNAKKQSA